MREWKARLWTIINNIFTINLVGLFMIVHPHLTSLSLSVDSWGEMNVSEWNRKGSTGEGRHYGLILAFRGLHFVWLVVNNVALSPRSSVFLFPTLTTGFLQSMMSVAV